MEAIAPALHAFYSNQLRDGDRQALHDRLLSYLDCDACVDAANAYVVKCTSKLGVEGDTVNVSSAEIDPIVLHYALHTLESRMRRSFASTVSEVRNILLKNLVDFVVTVYGWNRACSVSQTGHMDSSQIEKISVPHHVVAKAARAAVEIGKREWVIDGSALFPRLVFGLINENGHLALSPPRILGGMLILTILIDDALDISRSDMLSSHRSILTKRIVSVADKLIAALEVGLRVRGPGFPTNVPAAAARSMGSILRVAPNVAVEAVSILKRCVLMNASDEVGIESLAVLTDVYGESKIPLSESWETTLSHVSGLLEAVALSRDNTLHSEELSLYRKRLIVYAESVLCRCIAIPVAAPMLERSLNALMGVTMRWASVCPASFINVLDTWINMIEALEDSGGEASPLLRTALTALAELCLKACWYSTNGAVLKSLHSNDEEQVSALEDEARDDTFSFSRLGSIRDDESDVLADIGANPASLSSMASIFSAVCGGEGLVVTGVEESPEVDFDPCLISAQEYASKCVDTLACVARVLPELIGCAVAEKACAVLTFSFPGHVSATDLEDVSTACALGFAVSQLFPQDSDCARALIHAAYFRLRTPSCDFREYRNHMLLTRLMRLVTAVSMALSTPQCANREQMLATLSSIARQIVDDPSQRSTVRMAASLMSLALARTYLGDASFWEAPVSPLSIIRTNNRVISTLGVVGIASATINGPALGTSEQVGFPLRVSRLASFCGAIYEDFVASCSCDPTRFASDSVAKISRGAYIVRASFRFFDGKPGSCLDAAWGGLCRHLLSSAMSALHLMSEVRDKLLPSCDDDQRTEFFHAVGILIGCLSCGMRVFARQIKQENANISQEVIGRGITIAKGGGPSRLARSLVVLIRQELVDGFATDKQHLVLPMIELALHSLEGDIDVALTAVSVLGETISHHWLLFWPGDTAASSLEHGNHNESVRFTASNATFRDAFIRVMHVFLTCLRCGQVGLRRSVLLALDRLDASRKLFSRRAAFRDVGGPIAAVQGCLSSMVPGTTQANEATSANLVADEAASVLWGVGFVDWKLFYGREPRNDRSVKAVTSESTEKGLLQTGVQALGLCTTEQVALLLTDFGTPTDKPTFCRSVAALANDLSFCSSVNTKVSL